MSVNYAKELPHDKGGESLQGYPSAFRALARYGDENATTSSVISLTHDTTKIEIAAVGGPAVMRWVATSDTQASVVSAEGATANFDHVIPTGTFRQFVVPVEVIGNPSSVQGANRMNGLFQRVAIKSIGVASVMTTEY